MVYYIVHHYGWNVPVGFLEGISPTRETFTLNEKELTVFFEKVLEHNKDELELIRDYCNGVYNYIARGQQASLEANFYYKNGSTGIIDTAKQEDFSDIFSLWIYKKRIEDISSRSTNSLCRYFALRIPEIHGDKYAVKRYVLELKDLCDFDGVVENKKTYYLTINHKGGKYDVVIKAEQFPYHNTLKIEKIYFKNKVHFISPNKTTPLSSWKDQVEKICNTDYTSRLSSRYIKEIEKVKDNDFVMSHKLVYSLVDKLNEHGINVEVFNKDNCVDGTIIRRAYSQLFKTKNNASDAQTSYEIIHNIDKSNDINFTFLSIQEYSDKLQECDRVFVYDIEKTGWNKDTIFKPLNVTQVFALLTHAIYPGEKIAIVKKTKSIQKESKMLEQLDTYNISYSSISKVPSVIETIQFCIDNMEGAEEYIRLLVIQNCLMSNGYKSANKPSSLNYMRDICNVYNQLLTHGLYKSSLLDEVEKDRYDTDHYCTISSTIVDFFHTSTRLVDVKKYIKDRYNLDDTIKECEKMFLIDHSSYFSLVRDFKFTESEKKNIFNNIISSINRQISTT